VVRLDQIEHQMRALTGQLEQMQFRNQQLEQQLRRMQEDNEFRFQQMGGNPAQRAPAAASQPQMPPQQAPRQGAPMPQQGQPQPSPNQDIYNGPSPVRPLPGRRSDAFDPNANPSAPGAPRALGALPPGQPSAPQIMTEEAVGMRGRDAGSPLDLSAMSGNMSGSAPREMPQAAPQQMPSVQSQVAAVTPAAQTPKEQYDLSIGYIQRKDYAMAEGSLRDFVRRFPNDRLAPDAYYWLGESLFQRQRYQDAAETYLTVTTKFETAAKAPDSLLRLGQSLAAMGQKEMACASFGEVERKYPRASVAVKQSVEREIKRVRC
jgi:tol-pal system protein YbgF